MACGVGVLLSGGARGKHSCESCVSIRALQRDVSASDKWRDKIGSARERQSRRGGLSATAVLTLCSGGDARLRAIQEQPPDDIEAQERRTVGLDIPCGHRCQRTYLTGQPLSDLLDLRFGGSEGSGMLEEDGRRGLDEGTTRLPG
jgi:hypothetical protein